MFLSFFFSFFFEKYSKKILNKTKKNTFETKSQKKTLQNFLTKKIHPIQNQIIIIQLDEFRLEIQRRDQEILAMAAKMKTLEEQHQVNIVCLLFILLFLII